MGFETVPASAMVRVMGKPAASDNQRHPSGDVIGLGWRSAATCCALDLTNSYYRLVAISPRPSIAARASATDQRRHDRGQDLTAPQKKGSNEGF
jgi:hypothetical protein